MPTSEDTNEIRDILSLYGFSIYLAQQVETGLGIALNVYASIGKPDFRDENIHPSFAKVSLGLTVQSLKSTLTSEEKLEMKDVLNQYDRVTSRRNWLVHEFWEDRTENLTSVEGCKRIKSELREYITAFDEVDQLTKNVVAILITDHMKLSIEQISSNKVKSYLYRQEISSGFE